jgi:uncharacterized protein (DUF362 family)
MNFGEYIVAVTKENVSDYPDFPYNPPDDYPELKFLPYKTEIDLSNHIYEMTRNMLFMYKLDDENYGTEKWNPLSKIISEGNTVVIKPNLVRERNPFGERGALSTVTHSSLLRPIIDYTILALNKKGRIIICDAPLQSAVFDKICEINGLTNLMSFYQSKLNGIELQLFDLRSEMLILPERYHNKERLVKLKGDPLGYTIIDLGKDSLHSEIHQYWKKYVITGYDLKNLREHHTNIKHCYCISNSVLNADVIISVPKLKTHKKAGITVALKNFIGINASKDFLPHHRMGSLLEGGDEYPTNPSIFALVKDRFTKIVVNLPMLYPSFLQKGNISNRMVIKNEIKEGSWYGNDTLWRTILDLNTIVKYSDKKGCLCTTPERKFLFVVDGIIGQEGEGPMDGHPKNCGVLLLGMNPCAVDYVAAKIMGLNHKYLKQITNPFQRRTKAKYPLVKFDIDDIEVVSNIDEYIEIHKINREKSLKFTAQKNWKILEVDRND